MGGRVKAVYTVPELADLAGVSRWQMRTLLEGNQVPLRPVGVGKERRRVVVLLADLKAAFPELWASMVERCRLVRVPIER